MTVPCELRTLPASSTLVSGELTIKGANGWNDNATVNVINGQVWVYVTSIRTTGAITVSILNKYYTAASVTTVKFYGYSGNDQFANGTTIKTSYADGGSGNDTLSGGSNADLLHGGADKDYLYGHGGNDDLYGDGGDDRLYGGNDQDGLFGGDGTDKMYGEGGADRFLTSTDRSEAFDQSSIDATIWFLPGDIPWKENEVESVDVGLQVLHDTTANTNLLVDSGNRPLFFHRYHIRPKDAWKSAIADNTGLMIRFYDEAFASGSLTASTTVHEIAHSWFPYERTREGIAWNALSGWQRDHGAGNDLVRSGDGKWWYQISAKFARFYGRQNPHEDWATSWESYFVFNVPKLSNAFASEKLPSVKQKYLENFFKVQTLKT